MAAVPQAGQLERNAIGLPEVLFQSITHMAPAAAVAYSIIFATTYAGGATPLAVVIALVACLFVAVSIGQLARHLPSAGGLYTYNAHGLGASVGFLVAWGFMMLEPLIAPLLYLIFGYVLASAFHTYWGWPIELWAPLVVVAAAIVWYLTYHGIQLSTRTGVALGSFEIAVFAVLSLFLIVHAGSNNTLSVFAPNTGNVKGFGSVFPGMIFAILAFGGFEASAPLGEEARDPHRTIPRAVFLSCLLIGIFYLFCYYAATVYFGPDKMAAASPTGFYYANGGDPWTGMAKDVWGIGWILVLLAIANSAIANSNAGANAATRVGFALGRIHLLPSALAAIHPRYRTPYVAVNAQAIGGVIVAIALGWYFGSQAPLNAYALLGTIVTIFLIAIYILTNLSSMSFYWRERHDEFSWFLHFVIPIVGTLIFIPVLVASAGIDFAGLGITGLTYPASLAIPVVIIWMVIGVALLVYFRMRAPERIDQTAKLYISGEETSGT
jgi:amino acid transporter